MCPPLSFNVRWSMKPGWDPERMHVEPQETWKLFGIPDLYAFVEHLDMLFLDHESLVLVECIAKDIQDYLRSCSTPENSRGRTLLINPILPWIIDRPESVDFLVPITRDNLDGLSRLLSGHAENEVCAHLYVHRGDTVLMEGHDWTDGVFYVTGEVPEQKIRAFCETVGCRYERSRDCGLIEE